MFFHVAKPVWVIQYCFCLENSSTILRCLLITTQTNIVTYKVTYQVFLILDRPNGMNFTRGRDKLMFSLNALKISIWIQLFVAISELSGEVQTSRMIERNKKRTNWFVEEILNTLSNRLYDLFTSVKSLSEIWEAF